MEEIHALANGLKHPEFDSVMHELGEMPGPGRSRMNEALGDC
jgi:hypothetical protein